MNALRTRLRRPAGALRRFVRETRAGAGITAAAVTVMTVGGSALIVDHLWLYDQRDVLKTAAEAASIATTLEIDRQLARNPRLSDDDLRAALEPVAERYVKINLRHLSPERLQRAKDTLEVELREDEFNRQLRTVGVTVKADLGGTLFSRHLPLLGNYEGSGTITVKAGVESESTPVEVVLAIDITSSMAQDLAGRWHTAPENHRMTIVKGAARRLVDILDPNGYNRVAVGIVPWHVNVRLDAAAAREWARKGWARYPVRRTYDAPWSCHNCVATAVVHPLPAASALGTWKGCFDGHRIDAGTASLPDAADAAALFATPAQSPLAQSYFPPGHGSSYRCLGAADMPAGARNSCFENVHHNAQQNCVAQRAAMFPLSTERAAIERTIDALRPNGGINYSSLGVLWAQRMLEPAWRGVWGGAVHPADPATPEHADMRKALVLLTDGEEDFCGPSNPTCAGVSRDPLVLSRADVCTVAKARGTEVFVIGALKPANLSSAFAQRLRACSSASDRDYPQGTRRPGVDYVFLENATKEQLEAAFAEIANQLRTLRKVS